MSGAEGSILAGSYSFSFLVIVVLAFILTGSLLVEPAVRGFRRLRRNWHDWCDIFTKSE